MADYSSLPLFKLKKEAKAAGIDIAGLSKDELVEALESGGKGSKGSKGAKGGKASKGSKGAKGAKGGKSEEREAAPKKQSKGAKGAKGKTSKKSDDDEPSLSDLYALYNALRSDFDDLSESMAKRVDALEEGGGSDDDGDDSGDDDDDEAIAAARKVLKDHLDDEDNVSVTEAEIKKFTKKKLEALADYLGVDRPEGGLAKARKAMAEAYAEAEAGEDDEEGEDDGDEEGDDILEVEIDGEKLTLEPADESIFEAKFWKKGGDGHGRTFFILDEGEVVNVEVSTVKKDGDGDKYLVAKGDDGTDYTVYYVGEDGGEITALGFLVEDE